MYSLLLPLAVGVACFLGAQIGKFLSFPGADAATIWPPNGIMLAALCRCRLRDRIPIACAGIIANFTSDVGVYGYNPAISSGFCLANSLETWVSAWLLRGKRETQFRISNLNELWRYLAIVVGVGPLIGGTIGAITLAWFKGISLTDQFSLWAIGDAAGMLLCATPLLVSGDASSTAIRGRQRIYFSLAIIFAVAAAYFMFSRHTLPSLGFLRLPSTALILLMFASLGLGRICVLLLGAIIAAAGIYATTRGFGIIAETCPTMVERSVAVQVYLFVLTIGPLIAATIFEERETALGENRRHLGLLEGILAGTSDAVFVKDLAGIYRFVNLAMAQSHGKTPDAIIGLDDFALQPREIAESIVESDRRIIKTGVPDSYQRWIELPIGRRYFQVSKNILRDEAGAPNGIVVVAHDVTELERTSRLLQESAARYRTLADTAPIGIFEADPAGNGTYVNPAILKMTGRTAEELLSPTWPIMIHPDDRERVMHEWCVNVSAEVDSGIEFRILRPDGTILWCKTSAKAMRNEAGELRGYIGSFVDLSDEKEHEKTLLRWNADLELRVAERSEELAEAHKLLLKRTEERLALEEDLRIKSELLAHAARVSTLGEMASGIAHELQQPLTVTRAYIEGLRATASGKLPEKYPELAETLEQIERETVRAGNIVRRVRDFAKRAPFQPQATPAIEPVSEALAIMEFELRRSDCRVETEFPANLPPLMIDSIQIQQVLVNLIRNALEAMQNVPRSSRTIRLAVFPLRFSALYRISDTGCGVKPEIEREMFESFFTTKSGGLGLGLSLSRSIVEAHGGSLKLVSSRKPGATFEFELPYIGEKSEETDEEDSEVEPSEDASRD